MKTKVIFFLMVSIIILSCAQEKKSQTEDTQEKKSPIEGTWELVSVKRMSGDTLVWEFPGDISGSDIVIISEHHFLSIGRFEQDTTIYNNYVGASYTIEGNRYEETLLYYPNTDQVGTKVKALLEIQNDTLIKTWPLDDNWNIIESGYSIEKFIRLD